MKSYQVGNAQTVRNGNPEFLNQKCRLFTDQWSLILPALFATLPVLNCKVSIVKVPSFQTIRHSEIEVQSLNFTTIKTLCPNNKFFNSSKSIQRLITFESSSMSSHVKDSVQGSWGYTVYTSIYVYWAGKLAWRWEKQSLAQDKNARSANGNSYRLMMNLSSLWRIAYERVTRDANDVCWSKIALWKLNGICLHS